MNNIKSVLKEQVLLVKVDDETADKLKSSTKNFIESLDRALKKNKIDADVFVGGSFAKNTLVKKDKYDVDIFVRFDWRYDDISDILEKPLEKLCKEKKLKLERLHGSRDYFRAYINKQSYFELIPVTKIKKVHEERNVTDLSYFHVSYVRKKIKGIEDELRLAKTFCHAQKVYGAETYVKGFSGYALECLIIYYKSFAKMLRELSKVRLGERLIIDIEKKYKRKNDVFIELNDNKLYSPIILIDPTYKERNALASLSNETFDKFQKSAKSFLKKPSKSFFIEKEIEPELLKKKAKKSKFEFLELTIQTDRQPGDIAGTKLKKFAKFMEHELEKYFFVKKSEFDYDDKHQAKAYFILKSKEEVIKIGPPLRMKKHVRAFKKEHRKTYEKNKFVHATIKVNFDAKSYLNIWKKSNKKIVRDMGIVKLDFSN